MIIDYQSNAAWIRGNPTPSDDERAVLAQVTDALPDLPFTVRINNVCEYVKIAEGVYGGIPPNERRWVEYHFNVEAPTSEELYS